MKNAKNVKIQSSQSKILKSWLEFNNIGNVVEETRLIPFKTPISEEILTLNKIDQNYWFTVKDLIREVNNKGYNIGVIIDLRSSAPYYKIKELKKNNILYIQISCKLNSLEAHKQSFIQNVLDFLKKNPDEKTLIGVHCLHGLNRTGYMICAYLIEELNLTSIEAIQRFEKARQHAIRLQAKNSILSLKSNT